MNTIIAFTRLQLHSENTIKETTIPKTVAVYETEVFIQNEKTYSSQVGYKEIVKAVKLSSTQVTGNYDQLLSQYSWHLN